MDMNSEIVTILNGHYIDSVFVKGLVIFGAEILPYILLGSLLVWTVLSRDKKTAIRKTFMILVAGVFAVMLADMLKYWVNAPRPFVALDSVRVLVDHDPFGSFPSAHMSFFTAIAVAAFYKHAALSGGLLAGAVMIGISRIAAGVHFPLDILAGFFLGSAVALLVMYIEQRYRERYSWKRRLMFWRR